VAFVPVVSIRQGKQALLGEGIGPVGFERALFVLSEQIAVSGCLRRRGQGTIRPFYSVGLEWINLIAVKALEARPAVGCRHRLHAPGAARTSGWVHGNLLFLSQNEKMEQKFRLEVRVSISGERHAGSNRSRHEDLRYARKSDGAARASCAREGLKFPGKRHTDDENKLAVEGLRYLRASSLSTVGVDQK
jgi:hypothetical protein